jgi:beta-glucanase (GH16 family)
MSRILALWLLLMAGLLLHAAPHAQTNFPGSRSVPPLALDQTKWTEFTRAGALNSNIQCFTLGNIQRSGGFAIITAQAQSATCASIDLATATYPYTAGFFAMRSFNYLYGSLEYRLKVGPSGAGGNGQWPLVWMEAANCQASDPTGTDNNCDGNEIDVSEFLNTFTTVNQQIHVNSFAENDQCSPTVTDASLNYHVYSLVWSAGSLIFYIDGSVTCTITQSYVPSEAMYAKVTYYIGGQGGGSTITNSTMPWQMQLDYLKVGQGCTGVNPLSGCSSIIFDDEF